MSRLPVLPNAPAIRPSRATKWRAASLILVHLLIAAHLVHWALAGRTITPVEPSEAMAFAKAGVVNAGLLFFAAAILVTALFGRWVCGWACHLVAIQDLSRWLLEKAGIRPQPLRSRLLGWVPALAFVYMFLWPAIYRLALGDELAVEGYELTTSDFWATFPGWTIGILSFLVCGVAIIYFLGAKGFCTYACPYGAAFAAADRLSPMRIRVTDACQGCGHCTAVCTSNVRVHEEVRAYGMVVDSGCMKCRDCVSVCPNGALYYGFGPLPILARARAARAAPRHYPLTWPEEILLALAFAFAFFTFRGLYGEIPFLMALGLAGILAYLVLLGHRLLARQDFAWRRWRLKRGGRLLPAGWAAAAILAALAVVWLHSTVLQADALLGERTFRAAAPLRQAALDPTRPPSAIADGERQALARAAARFARLERWGVLAWRGADSRRAWLAWLTGDLATAERAATRSLAAGELVDEMGYLAARAALARGDRVAAAAVGSAALATAPRQPEAAWRLAVLLAQNGDLATAGGWLDRGIERFPDSTLLLYNAALVAAMGGEGERAIAGFARVLELDPGHRPARENLAGVLASVGRYGEAVTLYRQALDAAPDDVATRVLLARALAEAGEVEAALAEIDEALRRAPGEPAAAALRGALQAAK